MGTSGWWDCHSERSEESLENSGEILRCAQDDTGQDDTGQDDTAQDDTAQDDTRKNRHAIL